MLHLSEHAAYGRIEAARAVRQFPAILPMLADGTITLTAVTLLKPHLTVDNHQELLAAARHKSKRDVEHLIARLQPRPAVPSSIRRVPATRPGASVPATPHEVAVEPALKPQASPRRPVVTPIAPAIYKVQFSVGAETYQKLRRAQDLLRHTIPNGDPAEIFDRALTLLIADVEKTKLAASGWHVSATLAPYPCCR